MYLEVPAFGSDEPPSKGTTDLVDEAWFAAEQCEYAGHDKTSNCTWSAEERRMRERAPPDPSPVTANLDLEPIFYQFGVDICESRPPRYFHMAQLGHRSEWR